MREMLHHILRVYKLKVIVIICKRCKPDRSDHKYVFFNITWVKVVLLVDHGTKFHPGEELHLTFSQVFFAIDLSRRKRLVEMEFAP